jgi:hypothetical protein
VNGIIYKSSKDTKLKNENHPRFRAKKNSKMTQTITAHVIEERKHLPNSNNAAISYCNTATFQYFTSRPQRKLSYLIVKHLARISAHYSLFAEDKPRHGRQWIKVCEAFPRRTFSHFTVRCSKHDTSGPFVMKSYVFGSATYTSISRLSTTNSPLQNKARYPMAGRC